jgi:hypothetical protein
VRWLRIFAVFRLASAVPQWKGRCSWEASTEWSWLRGSRRRVSHSTNHTSFPSLGEMNSEWVLFVGLGSAVLAGPQLWRAAGFSKRHGSTLLGLSACVCATLRES